MAKKNNFTDTITNEAESYYSYHEWHVDPGQKPMRLDKFVTNLIEGVSRSKVQNAILVDSLKVNQKSVKNNYMVNPNDHITLMLPKPIESTNLLPEFIPLDILYEDNDILLINKQHNLVVHPGVGNFTGTLVQGILYHFHNLPKINDNTLRPGLVHRIDKNTTGIIVVAKNEFAHAHLSKQFFDHTIKRNYLALVWGCPSPKMGTINKNIGRDERHRQRMQVFEENDKGKHAITHYEVIEDLGYVSLVKCTLETGRTHQIRCHMSSIGHPIFMDEKYGGNKIVKGTIYTKYKQFCENCFNMFPRYALHAMRLGFEHPTLQKWIDYELPPPNDFLALLEKWRQYIQALKKANN